MTNLAELLGQTAAQEVIAKHLHHSGTRVWMRGPSGSGKSYIAEQVHLQWKRREGDSIIVSGDREQRDIPLYPLFRALRGWRFTPRLKDTIQKEGVSPLRDVPFVGNTLAFLVGLLGTASERPRYLGEDESTLLAELQSHSVEQTPFLIVVDNVHWLDSSSCRFLHRLLDDDVRESFSFARRVRLLFVETEDQAPVADPEGLERLRDTATLTFNVRLPSREIFQLVLESFGLSVELPAEVIDELGAITHGHLQLAQEIVRLANGRDLGAVSFRSNEALSSTAMKLLNARLKCVDPKGNKTERLLRTAACIGQTFSAKELKCAYDDPDAFWAALDVAVREEYLRGQEQLSFTHEIIQAALLSEGEPVEFHAKILQCLKSLRPSDLVSRFRHALLAKQDEVASELAFQLRIQVLSGNRFPGATDFETTVIRCSKGYEPELRAYQASLQKMDAGDHYGAIEILTALGLRDGIAGAEINYQLALNYFKLRTPGGYTTAESLLGIASIQTDELELWYRIMSSLSIVLANQQRMSEADRIRAKVITKLRLRNDPWSMKQRMILHRTASATLPPEAAAPEIAAAVEYFAPAAGTQVPRYAFQYVAALVNQSGVLFALGRYSQAGTVAILALETESSIRVAIRTVERYKICNNVAIAALRDQRLLPNEVVTFLQTATQNEPPTHDRILILNNLAVAEALSGLLEQSFRRLTEVHAHALEQGADRYYQFFVACNLAAVTHLSGDTEAGLRLWAQSASLFDGLPTYDQAMVAHRHKAFEAAFHDPNVVDAQSWDEYLANERPRFGEAWQFYRYGFLLSDITVWSES